MPSQKNFKRKDKTMNKSEFTKEEISTLCSLFMDGKLSRDEEKFLQLILENTEDLSPQASTVLKLMKAEKNIFSKSRSNNKARRWRYASVAAAILILGGFAISSWIYLTPKPEYEETFIVWQDGKRIEGEEARKIAEEEQQRHMQMIREVMKKQRELMKRNFASADLNENY